MPRGVKVLTTHSPWRSTRSRLGGESAHGRANKNKGKDKGKNKDGRTARVANPKTAISKASNDEVLELEKAGTRGALSVLEGRCSGEKGRPQRMVRLATFLASTATGSGNAKKAKARV